jgi:hypothetical protein
MLRTVDTAGLVKWTKLDEKLHRQGIDNVVNKPRKMTRKGINELGSQTGLIHTSQSRRVL